MTKETMIEELVERDLLSMPMCELLEYAKRGRANTLDNYPLSVVEYMYEDAFGIS